MLAHMVIRKCLSAGRGSLLTRLEDDHLARFTLDLAFPVVREHSLLQSIRRGLDVPTPLVLDDPKGTKPDLWVQSDEVG